jgi:hypothetical protein
MKTTTKIPKITRIFEPRYEIQTKPGIIIDAALVKRVATAHPKTTPTIIVYVDANDQDAFEKQIEGDSKVLGYWCDPRTPGKVVKEWKRP